MMMHQGSYQGHAPVMHPAGAQYAPPFYAPGQMPHSGFTRIVEIHTADLLKVNQMRGYPSPQPHYGHSPSQQFHYPPQPARMPSHGYTGHGQGATGPVQHGPPANGNMDGGDGMK